MHPLWFLLIFGVPVLLFLLALLMIYTKKVITVPTANTEWAVIENVATGGVRALGPGAHPVSPVWRERARVQLNREPVNVAGAEAEEIRSSDGFDILIEHRFDMLSGRPFFPLIPGRPLDPRTGQIGLYDPGPPEHFTPLDPDDRSAVTKEMVISAATAIEYADREERIREILKTAFDQEFGQLAGEQIMDPEAEFLRRPFHIGGVPIRDTTTLYDELAKRVEDRANRRLTHVGINVVDVQITNRKYKDPALQGAVEKRKRLAKIREAAQQLIDPAEGDRRLTVREAIAADTDQYGDVTKAEATRVAARSISEGIRDAAGAIGDGLRNFGRGP